MILLQGKQSKFRVTPWLKYSIRINHMYFIVLYLENSNRLRTSDLENVLRVQIQALFFIKMFGLLLDKLLPLKRKCLVKFSLLLLSNYLKSYNKYAIHCLSKCQYDCYPCMTPQGVPALRDNFYFNKCLKPTNKKGSAVQDEQKCQRDQNYLMTH